MSCVPNLCILSASMGNKSDGWKKYVGAVYFNSGKDF